MVGHLPIELSFLLCKFLSQKNCTLEFTGTRYLEDGLVVPGKYFAYSQIITKQINTMLHKELEKKVASLAHMKITVEPPKLKNIIR